MYENPTVYYRYFLQKPEIICVFRLEALSAYRLYFYTVQCGIANVNMKNW